MKTQWTRQSERIARYNLKLAAWGGPILLLPLAAWAGGTVTNCTEADFLAAAAGGGTVTFACDGTITLSQTFTNNIDLVLDATGHHVTISNPNGGILYVNPNVNLTMSNLTVAGMGAVPTGAGLFNNGGTVNLTGVTFSDNWASGATWTGGGAIRNELGTLNLQNCSLTGNKAWGGRTANQSYPGYGGAIYNNGTMNASRCTFGANTATTLPAVADAPGGDACGGAIYNLGVAIIDSCTFSGNRAAGVQAMGFGVHLCDLPGNPGGSGRGGALCNIGHLTVRNSSFLYNSVQAGNGSNGDGSRCDHYNPGKPGGQGGRGCGGALENAGTAMIASSTFMGNTAVGAAGGWGGGGSSYPTVGGLGGAGGDACGAVYNSGAIAFVNCSSAQNSAAGGTGGNGGPGGSGIGGAAGGAGGGGGSGSGFLWSENDRVAFTNCTIALNGAQGGSGGPGGPGGGGFPPAPPGGIGWTGAAAGCFHSSGGQLLNTILSANSPSNGPAIADIGHNLSSDNSCRFTAPGSMNNTDPKLGPLADNGGPTLTMALLPGSPAIDAGNTAAAPRTDQRGYLRPAGAAADIGAYEFGAIPPPSITMPPSSQTAETGSAPWFWVRVTNTPPESTHYQWYFSGLTALGGATNSHLCLTNVQSVQAGSYTVVVTNLAGAVTSPPAMLNVIVPVPRRMVPALTLMGQAGSFLSLDSRTTVDTSSSWENFDTVPLTNVSQWYFDLTVPLAQQRFYRAWQTNVLSRPSVRDVHLIPAITLNGSIGSSVRIDYINQFGPVDAWVTNLATVTLTNTSQLYFDTSVIGQPQRLYRLVPLP